MKYLKTYEGYVYPLEFGWIVSCIIDWLKEYNLNFVDLTSAHIEYVSKITGNTWIFKKVYAENKLVYAIVDYLDLDNDTRSAWNQPVMLNKFNEKTMQKVLDYLNNLTNEDIEEQKSKNEAEKFNF